MVNLNFIHQTQNLPTLSRHFTDTYILFNSLEISMLTLRHLFFGNSMWRFENFAVNKAVLFTKHYHIT